MIVIAELRKGGYSVGIILSSQSHAPRFTAPTIHTTIIKQHKYVRVLITRVPFPFPLPFPFSFLSIHIMHVHRYKSNICTFAVQRSISRSRGCTIIEKPLLSLSTN